MNTRKKILLMIFSITFIFLFGTLGFMIIEKANFFDSLYMTVITISSVGYTDILNLTPIGRVFNIFLILIGASVVIYNLSSLTSFLVEGELKDLLKGAKLKKMIKNLTNHHIICGSGTTAYKIIEDLKQKNENFIIIDSNKENIAFLKREFGEGCLIIESNPTRDEILLEAGIKEAKTLISVLPTDSENLFVSLSAKALNEECIVITRTTDYNNESKFHKAGADYIISPTKIAANKISGIATRKNISEYINLINESDVEDYSLEFIEIGNNSSLLGKTLLEAKIPNETGLIVMGIESDGKMKMNPNSSSIIKNNAKLLVFGTNEQLQILKKLAGNE